MAFNLVEGFVGEAECAAWIGDDLVPLGEGRFTFDARRPSDPWRVASADGAADLTMTPGSLHEEKRNMLVARSSFVQPCGQWSGTLSSPGAAPVTLERVLGVTEDQDVLW